jgi:hypothetical protein
MKPILLLILLSLTSVPTDPAPDQQTFEPARPSDYSPQHHLNVGRIDVSVKSSIKDCRYGQLFHFEGSITVDGPGVVTFTWDRSDGAYDSRGPRRMVFERAGTKRVSSTWKLSAYGETFWKRLHVFTPLDAISELALFTVDCKP